MKEPFVLADKVASVPAGSTVEILGAGNEVYVRPRFEDHEGYIASATIDAPYGWEIKTMLAALIDEAKASARKAKEDADRKDAEERWAKRVGREKALIKKYGQKVGKQVINGEAWIGMTAQQARDSWGEPEEINRTTTAQGTREQWVYGRRSYLYLELGLSPGSRTDSVRIAEQAFRLSQLGLGGRDAPSNGFLVALMLNVP